MDTKAKNAYELLAEIRSLILSDPLVYNQRITVDRYEPNSVIYDWGGERLAPACGTVGCRAGWVSELVSPRPRRLKDVVLYAKKVLGLSDDQADDLFDMNACYGTLPGTRDHASAGAKGLTRFMKKNRKQLLAKRIR